MTEASEYLVTFWPENGAVGGFRNFQTYEEALKFGYDSLKTMPEDAYFRVKVIHILKRN